MNWRIHHKAQTVSTNLDAREGRHGDVFTADFQSAGRGRLDHKWLSAPHENLMMSAVLSVEGLPPEHAATLPLVVGLAVAVGLERFARSGAVGPGMASAPAEFMLKWPNDVLFRGRKIAGILCERHGDMVVAGVGVNVNQGEFAPEIADRAVSLAGLMQTDGADAVSVDAVRDSLLEALDGLYATWRTGGLEPLMSALGARDALKGCMVSVRQMDDDASPVTGVCDGIASDGTLVVAGEHVWAGEAHVESFV